MWSGNWKRVQEAVESVLEGSPIMQQLDDQEDGRHHPVMPIKGSDIRHLSNKDNNTSSSSTVHHHHHHRIRTPRNRFKRPCSNNNNNNNNSTATRVVVVDSVVTREQQQQQHEYYDDDDDDDEPIKFSITGWVNEDESANELMMMMMKRAESHDSFSVETVEHSLVKSEPRTAMASGPTEILGLELTLGINPMRCASAAFNLDLV